MSGTGFEPSNARIEWLEKVITERLADPDTAGHDFCQDNRLGALGRPAGAGPFESTAGEDRLLAGVIGDPTSTIASAM